MSDRLQDLLRQRALLQEHLAWLDREIAQASPEAPRRPTAVPPPPAPASGYVAQQAAQIIRHAAAAPISPPASSSSDGNPAVAAAADAILSEYRVQPDTLKTDIRKGCFLYFAAALALVAAGVAILYFVISKH